MNRVNKCIVVATALVAFCAPVLSAAPRLDDHIARAKQFLRTLFPALGQTHVEILDDLALERPDPEAFINFTIRLFTSQTTHAALDQDSPFQAVSRFDSPLQAVFRFDFRNHDLRSVSILGPFVNDRIRRMEEEVDGHPEWSDDEVVTRLKAAGAKFGPDDREEFLRSIPFQKLEGIMGKIEVESADFAVRNRGGDEPVATLGWRVYAKCHSADGKFEADSIWLFEPFEGALWSFHVRSPRRPVRTKQ